MHHRINNTFLLRAHSDRPQGNVVYATSRRRCNMPLNAPLREPLNILHMAAGRQASRSHARAFGVSSGVWSESVLAWACLSIITPRHHRIHIRETASHVCDFIVVHENISRTIGDMSLD